ncbi:hypothetical protein HET73_02630 [Wolbachia endosymbiont of Atemnus politus]|uniref:hypothetical protein n=1 Tax=Wolbachia endosymbiont of Atemnus politus TaxID=2682840 RepID=UPI0015742E68|nr:hypothetical protein [Wolbachia endosymbiont of Atemnus politus]NSM56460.1 hypothetical protein [Wolbachia endosymbiont of Atemnus politus]
MANFKELGEDVLNNPTVATALAAALSAESGKMVSSGTPASTATIGRKPSGKQSIPVAPPKVPKGQDTSLEKEWSDFVNERMEKQKLSASTPKSTRSNSLDAGTLTRSDSLTSLTFTCSFKSTVSNHSLSDSGMGSGSSTPTSTKKLEEELKNA